MFKSSRCIKAFALVVFIICFIVVLFYNKEGTRETRTSLYEEVIPSSESLLHVKHLTNKWQPLGDDDAVPAGFHVRVNVATGKKEAKLLSEEKTTDEDNLPIVAPPPAQPRQGFHKVGFRIFKDNAVEDVDKKTVTTEGADYRTVGATLPNDFPVKAETNTAVGLPDLVEETKKLKEVLNLLESVSHQMDTGSTFILEKDGYRRVILPSLSVSDAAVREEALRLLAAAAQNNPSVQSSLVGQGAVGVILQALASDPSSEVKRTASYALSCLLRGSPGAQMQFLRKRGIRIVVQQFLSEPGNLKLQLHVVRMFESLLEERVSAINTHQNCNSESEDCQLAEEMFRKYSPLSYDARLEKEGWCPGLLRFLRTNVNDTEVVEEVTQDLVGPMMKICYKFYEELLSDHNNTELAAWFRGPHQHPRLRNVLSQIQKSISKYL